MVPIRDCTFVVFDLEATYSQFVSRHEIIEIGAYKLKRVNLEVEDSFETLVRPASPIIWPIKIKTGITEEMVCNVPPIEDVWEKFRFFINHAILVNHQVSMDMSILKTTAECLKLAPITNQVLCTLKLARRVFPKENSYGLPHLREILGIASNEKHRALKDAEDTTLLFKHMVEILEDRYKISGYQQLYDFCYSENPWQSQMF